MRERKNNSSTIPELLEQWLPNLQQHQQQQPMLPIPITTSTPRIGIRRQGSKASLPQTPQAVAAETPAIQTGGRIQVSVVSESSSSRQPSSVSSQLKRNEKAAIAWAAKAWHTAMKTRKRVMKRPHHSALRAYHVAKKLATIPTQPSHVKTDMHVADRKSPCRPPRQTGSLGKREKIGWACLSDIPDPGPSTAPLPCKVVECDASVNIRDAEEQAARAKALASVMAARNRKKKQQAAGCR
mmetsp:Transcript_28746/g.55898  ORF Transcript_28746/g.55898 Transcript_28746/m.55898 type:complete len:240 (-) Transcript_28746:80-799(-)